MRCDVAAFFDLDGTLLPEPSLERRFFRLLRRRKIIGVRNYCWWLAEALGLAPAGIHPVMHANKMYLRDVPADSYGANDFACLPLAFCREAVDCVAWHAERGHRIAIVSGTLEPLAQQAALALESELEARGLACSIRISATRLEEKGGRWTGRIAGEAMFAEAKARAIRRIAAEEDMDVARCFAYGDSANDRWMLETVGKPAAVNPSNDLARIAWRNDWPMLRWSEFRVSAQSSQQPESGMSAPKTMQHREAIAGAKSIDAAHARTELGT
ncbi:MAG: HAD-IB family hydrolase [Candidatus Acidiferrum sp.]